MNFAKQNLQAINLLKLLKETGRKYANEDEKETLRGFNGWGAIWRVFNEDHPQHKKLRDLLTPEEFEAASASILNAHYTDPRVVGAIWKAIMHLGLTPNCKALEPTCGIGYFISQCPIEEVEWTAVELDPIAAAITEYLHPEAKVYNQGFETVSFPEGYFDLAIGNVPFGSYSVYENGYQGLKIHNHFLLKSSRLVREGGLIALITSTGTMDSPGNAEFRKMLYLEARLIAAFRMPSGTMWNAKTSVTTDLLIFQKEKESCQNANWLKTGEWEGMPLNQYWIDNPEHLIGELCKDTLYGGDRVALKSTDRIVTKEIERLIYNFAPCCYKANQEAKIVISPDLQDLPRGAYVKIDGWAYIRSDNELIKVEKRENDRILANLWVLETLEKLLDAQLNSNDEDVEVIRKELNDRYGQFVKRFGYIRSKQNEVMECDPKYELLKSLEEPNFQKAQIFRERTTRGYRPPDRCETAKEALIHCLNTLGKVDLEWIAVRC